MCVSMFRVGQVAKCFQLCKQKGGGHVSIPPMFLVAIIRSVSMCGLYVYVLLSYFINTSQVNPVSAGSHPGWSDPCQPSC